MPGSGGKVPLPDVHQDDARARGARELLIVGDENASQSLDNSESAHVPAG